MSKVVLYAEPECWRFRRQRPDAWESFGCGPGDGIGDRLVPDTMYGLNVSEACRVHDWYYRFYPEDTEDARAMADRIFRNNLLRIVRAKTENPILRWLRERRCVAYYLAVRWRGGPAYHNDRNQSKNTNEVEV